MPWAQVSRLYPIIPPLPTNEITRSLTFLGRDSKAAYALVTLEVQMFKRWLLSYVTYIP